MNELKFHSHNEVFNLVFFPDSKKYNCSLEKVLLLKEGISFKLEKMTNVKIHLYKGVTLIACCEYVPRSKTKWHSMKIVSEIKIQKQLTKKITFIDVIKIRIKTEIKNNNLFSLSFFSRSIPQKQLAHISDNSITSHSKNYNSNNHIKVGLVSKNTISDNNSINKTQEINSLKQKLLPDKNKVIMNKRNLIKKRLKLFNSIDCKTLTICTSRKHNNRKLLMDGVINNSAQTTSKMRSVYNSKKQISNKTKTSNDNSNKMLSYERNSFLSSSNKTSRNIRNNYNSKIKVSNFRLEKKQKTQQSSQQQNEENNYDYITSYKNILEKTSLLPQHNTINILPQNELELSDEIFNHHEGLNKNDIYLTSSPISQNKFEEIKNDYNLIYTDSYITNIQNNALQIETQLFLDKIIEIQKIYHLELSQLIDEYKKYKDDIKQYSKLLLHLKRKYNLLLEHKEIENIKSLFNERNDKVDYISLSRKEIEYYSFVRTKSKKEKVQQMIKNEFTKLFLNVVTKHRKFLTNLQKKFVDDKHLNTSDDKNKDEEIRNSSSSLFGGCNCSKARHMAVNSISYNDKDYSKMCQDQLQ